MRKLVASFAALALCLALASPAAAFGDEDVDHGPMPLAIVHTIIGTTFFIISVPFTALIAPVHVMDSFEELVLDPVRLLTGNPQVGR